VALLAQRPHGPSGPARPQGPTGPPAQAGVGVGSSSYSPINVQSDFGAHGNGIDDDTHALQAAFDAPRWRDGGFELNLDFFRHHREDARDQSERR
jgi:hypothetical protein